MALPFLSSVLKALPAFGGVPTEDSLRRSDKRSNTALLHLNESPYPASPAVAAAIIAAAGAVHRYAEPRPARLQEKLAARFEVAPGQIVVGNGSDEVLQLIAMMAIEPGSNAVMPTPSFPRYRQATRMMGGEPRLVVNMPDGRNDVGGLLARVDAATRLLFVCTPNNPSGAALDAADLARLARETPPHVLLVLDEAYAEFDAVEGGVPTLPIIRAHRDTWVSARTFSKAYALAGLRIGYAVTGSSELAEALVKVKLNFNLNRLAVLAAEAALEETAYVQARLRDIIAERERLRAGLLALGLPVLPSRTNFLSFDWGSPAAPVMQALANMGLLVREWRDPGYETFIRVTVGLPEENDRVLVALRELHCRTLC